jgi:predicted transcriptional regulator
MAQSRLQLRRRLTAAATFATAGSVLGPLETRLLELLWIQASAVTVRRVHLALPELAYTTIMTTLDRLYHKGLLLRHRDGRAFAYEPRCTRDELLSELVSGHITDLLAASEESAVILSKLVGAVGRSDAGLLDQLEALVQAERFRLRMEDK